MEIYRNLSGNSGVVAYEISADAIVVEFQDGKVYRYTRESVGTAHIKQMKTMAVAGKGLSAFIVNNVKHKYAARLR